MKFKVGNMLTVLFHVKMREKTNKRELNFKYLTQNKHPTCYLFTMHSNWWGPRFPRPTRPPLVHFFVKTMLFFRWQTFEGEWVGLAVKFLKISHLMNGGGCVEGGVTINFLNVQRSIRVRTPEVRSPHERERTRERVWGVTFMMFECVCVRERETSRMRSACMRIWYYYALCSVFLRV